MLSPRVISKLAIVAREYADEKELHDQIRALGIPCRFDTRHPDAVITYGGDGTFLVAERKYPGVPKLILRKNSVCKLCHHGKLVDILKHVCAGEYSITEYQKLDVMHNKKKLPLRAANEIVFRNAHQTHAVRFDLRANHTRYTEVIGDGVVIATPIGGTGYFHSITHETIHEGVALAFNNTTQLHAPLFDIKTPIVIHLKRNIGHLSFDNYEKLIVVKPGDTLSIKQSVETVKIILVHFKNHA